jgi:hypothetical protein
VPAPSCGRAEGSPAGASGSAGKARRSPGAGDVADRGADRRDDFAHDLEDGLRLDGQQVLPQLHGRVALQPGDPGPELGDLGLRLQGGEAMGDKPLAPRDELLVLVARIQWLG